MDAERILVVDDEETLCEALKFNLEIEGYKVDVAYSAEQALTLPIEQMNLILLDVMMDGMNGFNMARQLKSKPETKDIPIIFLTAKDSEDDMVAGLTIGADDYISKPYSIRNVLTRIKTVLRRVGNVSKPSQSAIFFKGIEIDTNLKQVKIDGEVSKMPRKEYEILVLLLSQKGRIFSREEILNHVWEDGVVVVDRTIDVNITRLRQKLGKYGQHIITRSGYGYGIVE